MTTACGAWDLPITLTRAPGEAPDGFLERLAEANHLTHPELLTHADAGTSGDRPWALAGRSQVCGECLRTDRCWRTVWRHPWVAACITHSVWLLVDCPSCGNPFRSYSHTQLRPVDAAPGTCGNPGGARGQNCRQALGELPTEPVPAAVVACQTRLQAALNDEAIDSLGTGTPAGSYLADLTALAVLLLHLGIQPDAEHLAGWAGAARKDHDRSAGDHGARWSLAPPADPTLRGLVLTDADQILHTGSLGAAADALAPWLALTPGANQWQLGWLADHTTTMTPTLTRLVMAATATRRRISTLLSHRPQIPLERIPQVLPADLYDQHLAGMLDVTDPTGRLFASLCLARCGTPGQVWADAARHLGLPAETGISTARACSRHLACDTGTFTEAINQLAQQLAGGVAYGLREDVVRRLAGRSRWYRTWARTHHPAAHASSRRYITTWLWTSYAGGHLTTSPGWTAPPTARERDYYRRCIGRLTEPARAALIDLATAEERRTR